MRKHYGRYSIGLATLAWAATLGHAMAVEPTIPTEPPAELFCFVESDDSCAQCEGRPDDRRSETSGGVTWFEIGSRCHLHDACVAWNTAPGGASVPTWHFSPSSPVFHVSCGFCLGEECRSSNSCQNPIALDWTAFATEAGKTSIACQTTHDSAAWPDLAPGEPAEVLLEIRSQLGQSPLTGTLYQAADVTDQCHAQNTFVDEVRASECVAEVSLAPAVASVAHAEPIPLEAPSDVATLASAELVELLRSAGRDLEQAANTFEDLGDFSRADRLREIATQLRLEARIALGILADEGKLDVIAPAQVRQK